MDYQKSIIIAIFFSLTIITITHAATHSRYTSFNEPINSFTIDKQFLNFSENNIQTINIEIRDEIIFKTAYYSLEGKTWTPINLTGNNFDNNWINKTANFNLELTNNSFTVDGESYIIIFSCELVNFSWSCHDNRWQLQTFNITLPKKTNQTQSIKGLLAQDFENGLQTPFLDGSDNCISLSISTNEAYSGSQSLRLESTCSDDGYTNPYEGAEANILSVNGAAEAEISVYIKGSGSGFLDLMCLNAQNNYQSYEEISFTANNEWQKITVTNNCPGTTRGFSTQLGIIGNGDIYVDQATINLISGQQQVECINDNECTEGTNCQTSSCNAGTCEYTDIPGCGEIICGNNTDGQCPSENTCIQSLDIDCPECKQNSQCPDDNNFCTTDSCNSGQCTYTNTPGCDPNDRCSIMICNDGNPCTSDSCESETCVNSPIQGCTGPTTYYLDAQNGNDGNDGSNSNPFRTVSRVMQELNGGETIILREGNYGYLNIGVDGAGNPVDLFNDWVSFRASPEENVEFERIAIGYDPDHPTGHGNDNSFKTTSDQGAMTAYVKFIGFQVDDRIEVFGSRYVELHNNTINCHYPLIGPDGIGDRSGVAVNYAADILVEGNEITEVPIGITVAWNSHRITLRNNHIHHIAHDGLQFSGAHDTLVEGNHIHNLDDGIPEQGEPWDLHCDGIHFYPADTNPRNRNENVIVRGNRIYHAENSIIQFNGQGPGQDFSDRNVIIENNVFGPGGDGYTVNMDAPQLDGIIYRHNTHPDVGSGTFTSIFGRVIPYGDKSELDYMVSMGWRNTNVYVYNNIITDRLGNGGTYVADNIILNGGTAEQFVNPEAYDGVLRSDSIAINNGNRHDTSAQQSIGAYTEYDMYGTTRDSNPDVGAYEYP